MKNKSVWGALLSLVVTVAVLTVFGGIAVSADPTVVDSGSCGDNVTYTLYSDGLMEITGTGAMTDYSYGAAVPWYDYKADITSVTISSGITHIGANSFNYYYTNIETVSIPDSVTSIGRYAFYYCINLTTADLSDNITEIGDYAFYYCEKLDIPNFPHNIQYIGEAAFQKCLGLTELTIPDSVTSIGNRAFASCQNMETLNFPAAENLKFDTIPSGCFIDCEKLTAITIPYGIKSLDTYAFKGCTSLSSVEIPATLEEIGGGAFESCSSLKDLPIQNTVKTIGDEAFSRSGLTSFTIPDSITEIPMYCFSGCPDLVTVDIPNSVTTIGESAFEGCSGLKSVIIPDHVREIPYCAFCECSGLVSVTIPNSVTSIGRAAFSGCSKLTNVVIPDGVTSIESMAFQGTAIESIELPGSLETVKEYAFSNNEYLQSVTFKWGVGNIESRAFDGCDNIKVARIPASVWNIGEYGLGSGYSMTDIYCYVDPDNYFQFIFEGNFNENTKIHVPIGYLTLYRSNYEYISDLFVGDLSGHIEIGSSSSHLCGHSITIDGSIGVNFYMTLGDNVLSNADTAYMQFTVNGKTQKVKISEASRAEDYYIFRCNVVAKEMTDTITAQIYLSEGNPDGDAYTYTVRDYAVYILDHQSVYGKAVVDVVNEMLNYGAAAQIYFNYNTSDLANSVVNDSNKPSMFEGAYKFIDVLSRITYRDFGTYNDEFVTTVGDVKLSMASLSLKSTLTLKLYFENVPEGTFFEYKDKEIATTKSGKYTVVTIEGINPYYINAWVEIDVSYGETNGTIIYNPLKYVYNVMKADYDTKVTWQLKQLMSSLIEFDFALSEYYNPQQ